MYVLYSCAAKKLPGIKRAQLCLPSLSYDPATEREM